MPFSALDAVLPEFPLIINTVPAMVLGEKQLDLLKPDALVLDLASKPGGDDAEDKYSGQLYIIVFGGMPTDRTDGEYRMDKQDRRWMTAACICAALTGIAALATVFLRQPDKTSQIVVYTAPVTELTEVQRVLTEPDITQTTAPADSRTQPHTETTAPDRNLNTADAAALRSVPGVGELLAAEIIRLRDVRGGFTRRAELLDVPGIGEVLAARIMEAFEIPDELPPETTAPHTEATTRTTVTESAAPESHPIYDINSVTRDELLTIPEMTPDMADALLDFRAKIGAFHSVYELAVLEQFPGSYVQHTCWDWLCAGEDTVTKPRPREE